MRRLRILLELVVACSIAGWGGANVYLSGGKFSWPPPQQLKPAALWSSAQAEIGKLAGGNKPAAP